MSRDALVVGINQYQDDRLRNLNAPALDGEAIANILEKYGDFNVWRLPEAINKETRKPYVGSELTVNLPKLEDSLIQLFKPEGGKRVPDTALFYFSGHGLRKEKGIQEGFLATSDVNINSRFYGLSLKWLQRLLQESPVRKQIIWLDCCHSGEFLNFDEAYPGTQGQATERCFIASSREFEPSFQDLKTDYSVFTRLLLSGLDPNRSPEQLVTTTSLKEFIDNNLRRENQRSVSYIFGEAIILTSNQEPKTSILKGQDSEEICPYKGLEYFDFNDKDPKYFYGREKLTDKLIDRVRQSNFLAILGASGSGKSSVLRAGLLHQLKLGRKLAGSQDWKIQIMLPGQHPLQNLALSWLEPNLSDAERASQLDDIESLLQQGGEGLRKLVQASRANRLILVIDQFEEAFTLCQEIREREDFVQCLLEGLEQTDNKLCLILAMRIDFFGKCVERKYSGLSQIIQANLITIPLMETEELRQAIIKPAEKVKLSLESGLAEEILRDIEGSPGSLPLLQDTLTELWKRRKDNQLKFTAYSQLGGIGGTLNQRATEVYNSLTKQEQDCTQHIFLSLTRLGEGTEDTRRRVLKQDLVTAKHDQKLIDHVVQRLADEKLIVTKNRLEQSSEVGLQAEVDVAHEALIRNWILLRQWLDECRDKLKQERKIENAAQEWQSSGQKTEYLLSKKRLKEAKEFQKEQQQKYPLSELAASFVDQSIKHQKKEAIKSLGLFLIIPLIGTITGGYFLIREIQLNADKKLIQNCEGKDDCSGRIEALTRLVQAKKSLKDYNLYGANLEHTNLKNAKLTDANFENANLYSTDLRNGNLYGADFGGADLRRADLRYADLRYADLRNADLRDADLYGADLRNADLSSANLKYTNIDEKTKLSDKWRLVWKIVNQGAEHEELENADLVGANLENANLYGANLKNANLVGANLYGANLENANLVGANLYGANLVGANLENANLKSANLKNANLKNANLYLANLKNANLKNTNLKNANLRYAYFADADLRDADLRYTDLRYAELIATKNLTPSQIKSGCYWQEAFYKANWNNENWKWLIDKKANKEYIEQLKQHKASDPKNPVDCNEWE